MPDYTTPQAAAAGPLFGGEPEPAKCARCGRSFRAEGGPCPHCPKPGEAPALSDKTLKELGLERGRCSSCGAAVLWGKMKGTGQPQILQAKARQVYVVTTGPDGKPDGSGRVEYRRAFESHFADCPNARMHKGGGR